MDYRIEVVLRKTAIYRFPILIPAKFVATVKGDWHH